MAPVHVEVHTTIDRARADVAAYCCEPANIPTWQANITAVQWETPPPLALGSRWGFSSGFLGRTLRYTCEVVELVAAERLVLRSDAATYPMETTYEWQDTDDGATWMTLRNRGAPTAYRGLATPLVATAIRRATTMDLTRLKAILEAR